MGRTIYCAIGEFPPDRHGAARDLLKRFDAGLASGLTEQQLAAAFPLAARGSAQAAALLIRQFESRVGEPCGAQVGTNTSPLAGIGAEHSLSVENRGAKLFGPEVADLAARVAAALAQLLLALGATRTISGHLD